MHSYFKVNMQEDEMSTWKRHGLGITESKTPYVWGFSRRNEDKLAERRQIVAQHVCFALQLTCLCIS